MIKIILPGLAVLLALPGSANAEEDCTDAKDVLNLVEAFHAPDPDLLEFISPQLTLRLKSLDDRPLPDVVYYKLGETRIDFPLDETGQVTGLANMVGQDPDGEVCSLRDRPSADPDKDSTQANMGFRFLYKDADGAHSIDELRTGAKHGSKIMNKLAPAGMGMFVPNLKRVIITPENPETDLQLSVTRKGETEPFDKFKRLGPAYSLKLKDLKRSRADSLLVTGGAYTIEASFEADD